MAKKEAVLAGLICCSVVASKNVNSQTFILDDESTIEGKITRSTNNTILVMEENGVTVPLSLANIKEVQMPIDGRKSDLAASLVSWDDGIYELRTEKYTIRVSEGNILSLEEEGIGTGGPIFNDRVPPGQEKAANPEETKGKSSTSWNQPNPNATM